MVHMASLKRSGCKRWYSTSLGQCHLGGIDGELSAVEGRDHGERRKRGESSETTHFDWVLWWLVTEDPGIGDLRRTGNAVQ